MVHKPIYPVDRNVATPAGSATYIVCRSEIGRYYAASQSHANGAHEVVERDLTMAAAISRAMGLNASARSCSAGGTS